jgi:hypothetical protein
MKTGRSVRRSHVGLGVLVAAIMVASAGCSSSSGTPAAENSQSETPDPAATASAEAVADRSACQAVQDIFVNLASVSAKWDRARDPFDRAAAEAIFPMAEQLRSEARAAGTRHLKVVIESNADALDALSTAMIAQQKAQFHTALAQTQHAYAALPACAHRDGQPTAQQGSSSASPGSTSPSTSPTPRTSPVQAEHARDPGCIEAKDAYIRLVSATSAWNVGADPFDASTAKELRRASNALDAAAQHASSRAVRTAVEGDARAFQRLTAAMGARDRRGVNDGVVAVQQLTRTLAATCPLI